MEALGAVAPRDEIRSAIAATVLMAKILPD
jgi:hypothetical protein